MAVIFDPITGQVISIPDSSGGGGGAVNSVNGQTGTVQLDADNIPYDNSTSGLTATEVQAAIDELETLITPVTPEVRPISFVSGEGAVIPDNADIVWVDTNITDYSILLPANPQENQILKIVGVGGVPTGKVTLNPNSGQGIDGALPLVEYQKGVVVNFIGGNWYTVLAGATNPQFNSNNILTPLIFNFNASALITAQNPPSGQTGSSIEIYAGDGNSSGGGNIVLNAGEGDINSGGDVIVQAGEGTGGFSGGNVFIRGGDADGGGGSISIEVGQDVVNNSQGRINILPKVEGPAVLAFLEFSQEHAVGIRAPDNVTGNYTIVLPESQGNSGATLVNDGAGNLTWKSPVIFDAGKSTAQATGGGNTTIINWDTPNIDTANAFDETTGEFTVPETRAYRVSCNIGSDPLGNVSYIQILVNSVSVAIHEIPGTSGVNKCHQLNRILNLSAGDVVTINFNSAATPTNIIGDPTYTNFSINSVN